MQFKKCAVVGVLIILCLSTDSWCHYIPEKEPYLAPKKNASSSSQSKPIQICGKALTNLLMQACNGSFNSYSQVNPNTGSVGATLTEDCCDNGCDREDIQSYCGDNQLFSSKETFRGRSTNSLTRNRSPGLGANEKASYKGKNKKITEVRVREKKNGRRKWGKSKKRKRPFKRKFAYKSFGHYLLKFERGDRVGDNMAKSQNTIRKKWPSIQIGTISPEMDKFGGQPIVVVKKKTQIPYESV